MIIKIVYSLLILQITKNISGNPYGFVLLVKNYNDDRDLVQSLNKTSSFLIRKFNNQIHTNEIVKKNSTNTEVKIDNLVGNSSKITDNIVSNISSTRLQIISNVKSIPIAQNFTVILPINTVVSNESTLARNASIIVNNQTTNLNSTLVINGTNKTTVNQIYELDTTFKIVSIENTNINRPLEKLASLEQLIKHSILKHFGSQLERVGVSLSTNNTRIIFESFWPSRVKLPIFFNVTVKSSIEITEDQFQNALVNFAINTQKCNFNINETVVRCSIFKNKDTNSLLRISDYWIELDHLAPFHQKLESEIFTYKPAWIIGLIIIGCIIAIFFVGCIIAICYTRRPYRRCGKVYEIESGVRKNNQIPQIPGIHPTTKASAVTKTKEMYYQ